MRAAGRIRIDSVGMKMQARVIAVMTVTLSVVTVRGEGFMCGPGVGVCF